MAWWCGLQRERQWGQLSITQQLLQHGLLRL